MPSGGCERAVGLDRDLEARLVQGLDEGGIHLQERLPAGAHDERRAAAVGARPLPGHGRRQLAGGAELAAAVAVGAHEFGVAERADRRGAILLVPAPEIAACEAAEDGRPPGVRSLALQRVEDLLDGVGHRRAASGW